MSSICLSVCLSPTPSRFCFSLNISWGVCILWFPCALILKCFWSPMSLFALPCHNHCCVVWSMSLFSVFCLSVSSSLLYLQSLHKFLRLLRLLWWVEVSQSIQAVGCPLHTLCLLDQLCSTHSNLTTHMVKKPLGFHFFKIMTLSGLWWGNR